MDAETLRRSLAEAELKSQQLQEQLRTTEARLQTDPRCLAFLDALPPTERESLIQHYLNRKAHYLTNGPEMLRHQLHDTIEHQEDAYERMFDIQQKKLFDLQVEWRAGRIRLPGIRVCHQFRHWEHNIHRCPFLPPITVAEYELYREYLATAAQDVGFLPGSHRADCWQHYDGMREQWEQIQAGVDLHQRDGIEYPAWYTYVDQHLQRPAGYPFVTEPDKRGERQEHYIQLAYAEQAAQAPPRAPAAPPAPPDPRPEYRTRAPYYIPDAFTDPPDRHLVPKDGDDHFAEFTRRFHPDADHVLALNRAMRTENSTYSNTLHRRALDGYFLLHETDDFLPVFAHPDWRYSFTCTASDHHRRVLLAALPTVWAEYEFRIATGLQPAKPDQYRALHDGTEHDCFPPTKTRKSGLSRKSHPARPRAGRRAARLGVLSSFNFYSRQRPRLIVPARIDLRHPHASVNCRPVGQRQPQPARQQHGLFIDRTYTLGLQHAQNAQIAVPQGLPSGRNQRF